MNAERANPSDAIRKYSQESPNSLAFFNDSLSLNYAQLERLINVACTFVENWRIPPKAAVGLLLDDQLLFLIFSLVCIRSGNPQVILHPKQSAQDRERLLSQSAASALVTDQDINVTDTLAVHKLPNLDALIRHAREASDIALHSWNRSALILSFQGSGTTGAPKAIHHSAEGLADMIRRDILARPIHSRDRHLSLSRLNYFTALRRSFAAFCSFGTVATLNDTVSPRQLVNFCNSYRIDHLSMISLHVQNLVRGSQSDKTILPDLKSVTLGSSPIPGSIRKLVTDRINCNLYIAYGTNEFGEATVLEYSPEKPAPEDSVGYPCPEVEIRIMGENGSRLPAGATGEISLKSRVKFPGHANPEDPDPIGQEWFPTGDLGFLTEQGELIFCGRKDDLMIFNGINIYPREIESLLENHPLIREAAAFPLPSERHGDIPVACVTCNKHPVDSKLLLRYATDRLGTKAPKQIYVLDELPKNAGGKVLKRKLREQLPHQ